METYLKAILRNWWLFIIVAILSFRIGSNIAANLTSQYIATSTVLLNGGRLAQDAIPSQVVQLKTPASYPAEVLSQDVLSRIVKAYPRFDEKNLLKNISVTTESTEQLLYISVTDISPESAADIDRFLTQQFVARENTQLKRQLDYYRTTLSQNLNTLNKDINYLINKINQETPSPVRGAPPPPNPTPSRIIAEDQYRLNRDQAELYQDQQALQDIAQTQNLFNSAYVIIHPPTQSTVPVTSALPSTRVEGIAAGVGILILIILIFTIEYFSPFVRNKGELERIAGFSVLAEIPKMSRLDQKRLVQSRPTFFKWHTKALHQVCSFIGALVTKDKGHILLLTSPSRKHTFASVLAVFLSHSGYHTLLIDGNFENSRPYKQVELLGPCNFVTKQGTLLNFIQKTSNPRLFMLSATAHIKPNEHIDSMSLSALLPELQQIFNITIIDAPPLNHSDTHLLATKAHQTVLLVRKRRDSLKNLKLVHTLSQELKLNIRCLLLS